MLEQERLGRLRPEQARPPTHAAHRCLARRAYPPSNPAYPSRSDPQAFAPAAAGTFGSPERNLIPGPSFQSWDIALFKNVPLGGSRRLQLRLEAFNFTNHPNLDNPAASSQGGGNGNIINPTSADFGRVLGKSGNRNLQLGVKFMF